MLSGRAGCWLPISFSANVCASRPTCKGVKAFFPPLLYDLSYHFLFSIKKTLIAENTIVLRLHPTKTVKIICDLLYNQVRIIKQGQPNGHVTFSLLNYCIRYITFLWCHSILFRLDVYVIILSIDFYHFFRPASNFVWGIICTRSKPTSNINLHLYSQILLKARSFTTNLIIHSLMGYFLASPKMKLLNTFKQFLDLRFRNIAEGFTQLCSSISI